MFQVGKNTTTRSPSPYRYQAMSQPPSPGAIPRSRGVGLGITFVSLQTTAAPTGSATLENRQSSTLRWRARVDRMLGWRRGGARVMEVRAGREYSTGDGVLDDMTQTTAGVLELAATVYGVGAAAAVLLQARQLLRRRRSCDVSARFFA